MNKVLKTVLKGGLSLTSICLLLTSCANNEPGYYDKVTDDLMGQDLEDVLSEIIYHEKAINYANVASYYPKTDSAGVENKIILFYNGEVCSTKMGDPDYKPMQAGEADDPNILNREHVWCQSRFRIYGSLDGTYGKAANPGPATDLYNVRPCRGDINVHRSNIIYGENSSALYDPATIEGGDATYRGEAARIIFYCATRYQKLDILDVENVTTGPKSHEFGKLSDLLRWNLAYAPNDREKLRNDAVQEIQGNRNPFVDHPEYACRIYGNTNETTKSICKEYLK